MEHINKRCYNRRASQSFCSGPQDSGPNHTVGPTAAGGPLPYPREGLRLGKIHRVGLGKIHNIEATN